MPPGVWGGFTGGAAPPTGRPLMPARLMNLLLNPFAMQTGNGAANWGKDVYLAGDGSILPMPSGTPQWPFIEFTNPTLGAGKTGRGRITLPDDFVLLNFWGSASQNAKGGFRVNVYDINRRQTLTMRPINFNTYAGQGSAPLFLRAPYPFGRSVNNSPPQAKITIVNLETVANSIQFGFYGMIVPGWRQK